LVLGAGVKALVDGESHAVWVTLDLVDVSMLVLELATDAVGAGAGREEGLAVLIFLDNCGFILQFLSAVGEFALFSVATVAVLAVRFAEFSLVKGLVLVGNGSIGSLLFSSVEAHWVVGDLRVEGGRLSWLEGEGRSVHVHL